jgi:hypothetical protein
MSDRRRCVAVVLGSVMALWMGACNDGGITEPCPAGTTGSPPNCTPTPTPCTQTSALQDSGGIPARTIVYDDFSVPDSGRLDVTMDWTNASSQMGFYLVPANTCTLAEFNARSCNFLIRSETGAKPRKISTPSFAAGNYRWMIANFSQDQESASLQVILSKGACAALGVPPAASGRADETLPPIERALQR